MAIRVPRKTEYYLGEDRGDIYEFAHAMIDAGIYSIISHPSEVVPFSSLSIIDLCVNSV